ncbi:MAG TPA: insulinase family protein [Xanthobacteraceae bacterium]|nr:insulinase family protein [Xanthobacteraceae bacterium]
MPPRRAPLRLLLAALLALPCAAALGAEERVGERLFLVRDQPGTRTHFQMIVLAGCLDEAYGQCRGLAHYLEHLVLVGRNPEHTDIAVRFFPDSYANGWTSQRGTRYVHIMPAREGGPRADLEKLFAFYAARLKDFSISAEDAVRERNVVLQEHDWRVASKPFERFQRTLDRELLPDHPSGQWTVGTREDIEAFTINDAKAFLRAWYAPNNVYFAVKGDVDPVMLKEIADRALAGIPARPLPPRAFAMRPNIDNERIEVREQDTAVKRAGLYFKKLVRMEESDLAAHWAARTITVNFLGSRLPGSLHDAVVDNGRLAAAAPNIALNRVAPNSFVLTIGADVAPDVPPEKLLAAISDYVGRLGDNGISPETVERLKKRFADARANADRHPQQVYDRLIEWLAEVRPYEDLAAVPQRIAAVTPDAVAAIARGISGPGRVVTGILTPASPEAAQ